MTDFEILGDDLATRRADLEAEVEVVAVWKAQRLVETQVVDDPRRQRQQEPVDRVHLAGSRVGGVLVAVPRSRRKLAAAELSIAVEGGRPGHRSLPPGDAADADRAQAAHHPDIRITERPPQL